MGKKDNDQITPDTCPGLDKLFSRLANQQSINFLDMMLALSEITNYHTGPGCDSNSCPDCLTPSKLDELGTDGV